MIINFWHSLLNMPKENRDWHIKDIAEELGELKKAKGLLDLWSEKSDVVYTHTRAQWSGHKDLKFPLSGLDFLIGAVYMLPKYTLRYLFFYIAGKRIDKNVWLREVRNPYKLDKLRHIASKYGLDPVAFELECDKLLKYWLFLK